MRHICYIYYIIYIVIIILLYILYYLQYIVIIIFYIIGIYVETKIFRKKIIEKKNKTSGTLISRVRCQAEVGCIIQQPKGI